jgi:hypothetical protein
MQCWYADACACSRYGRPGASDEEVEGAARVAAIHDAITQRFRKGWVTQAGAAPPLGWQPYTGHFPSILSRLVYIPWLLFCAPPLMAAASGQRLRTQQHMPTQSR